MQNEALVLDLLEWIEIRPRTYQETMSAWKTSCPRLTVWEDAIDARLVALGPEREIGQRVYVTDVGIDYLKARRAASQAVAGSRSA